ncbi:MAG: peptide-methionine (S)-S-oxide reductase [Crocinitomicaceae bacterium]|nr:peptide-methionine (S)-S-oxide reductase [Crocinitomicaceae bacterium]
MERFSARNRSQNVSCTLDLVKRTYLVTVLFVLSNTHLQAQNEQMDSNTHLPQDNSEPALSPETITLGAGCFWCVEAVFESLKGVHSAQSGYMGGHIKNPGYREVCTGRTGHAEVVQVVYDATVLSTSTLLDVFFSTHDPTTLNRQGADAGTQYRSAIYFHSAQQEKDAREALEKAQEAWSHPIVTEVKESSEFYVAEDYHQAYYELNDEAPYCRAVILPKMQKMRSGFQHLLKIK